MNKMKLLSPILLFLLLLTACSTGSADDDVKVMRLAVASSEDRSLTQGLYKFEELVEEQTDTIDVQVFPSSQLGGDRLAFEGLMTNTVQGATMSTGPISQFSKRFVVFDLPYLFPDAETAYEVLDGPLGQELLEELPELNVIGLNYWENGFRALTNNTREVSSPEDMKGLKIRVLENTLHIDAFEAMGAAPTPMAYNELFTAMEQHIVDGQDNPVGNVINDGFYEVQQYITETRHIYNASPFLVSKEFYDALTEEEQQIIRDASEEAKVYQRELNQQEDTEGYAALEEEGMTVTRLTEEQRQQFAEATKPLYKKYENTIGEDYLTRLTEELGITYK